MAEFVNPGDSIEGQRILVAGKKIISAGPPIRDQVTKALRWGIAIKQGGRAKIDRAFNPPAARINANSHLNKGDILIGESLEGSSLSNFSPDDLIVGKGARSHRHNNQMWMMKGECYVQISRDIKKQAAPLLALPGPAAAAQIGPAI